MLTKQKSLSSLIHDIMIILKCKIEGCNNATENCEIGLCATHARLARKASAPKAKPARRRIAKQSDEGKERMATYMPIRNMFLTINMMCKPCHDEGKLNFATEVHHMKSRLGDLLYDMRHFLPVCREHHTFIHDHPEIAYEKGWSLSRHQTETI